MNTRPKSSELIKSQFADYAESLGSDSVFKKYGKSVLAEVEKQEKTAESESVYHDYVQFLRSEGLDDRERQKKEAAVLARYADFSDAVNILRHNETTQELGRGTRSSVFPLELGGKTFAVRFIDTPDEDTQYLVHRHVVAGVVADDIPGLEKIVAASYKNGVVISEFVEGKHVSDMTQDEIREIPEEHIGALVQTTMSASLRGIKFDPVEGNVLYDPMKGFTEIDYGIGGKVLDKVGAMLEVLTSFSHQGGPADNENVDSDKREKLSLMRDKFMKYIFTHVTPEEKKALFDKLRWLEAVQQAGKQR